MSFIRTNLHKCRIIFFDLEFYVPDSSRIENTFCYNPWDKDSKLLGGAFLVVNPTRDFDLTDQQVHSKIKTFWLWKYQSERELLTEIYKLLSKTEKIVSKAHKNRLSPILCGIGITSSDVPIIFELFKRYQILSNQEAFVLQNKYRYIDLSQLGIATFNNSNKFLYPKTKNTLLGKYLNGTKFEAGYTVWEMYENNQLKDIEKRTRREVLITHKCYEKIHTDISNFKILEKSEKRRLELEQKNK